MNVRKSTAVLPVESIEDCLPFWLEALGFQRTVEVPGPNGKLGFVILVSGEAEVMLQSRASVRDDLPVVLERAAPGSAFLFLEVEDLDALAPRVERYQMVPERTTFYGMRERVLQDPAGHVVVLAQPSHG